MARSNVPKFGNWDSEENISYTTYFENARRVSSTSEKVNASNSVDNPSAISTQEGVRRTETARVKHERTVSQGDGQLQRPVESPSPHDGRRASRDSTHQQVDRVSTDIPKKPARPSGGGVRSAGQSPLHPYQQGKLGSKGSTMSSPSWERRVSSEGNHGLAPSTPGRSRLKSVPRGNETPDRGASVPKFGAWDETDPSSADQYSQIFNKVKEERHGSGTNAPGSGTNTQRYSGQKQYRSKDSKGCCCFPWGGN